MVRRKMLVTPSGKAAPDSKDDYVAYVSTSFDPATGYFGELVLVRHTDARKLYPFDGAAVIGPYATVHAARRAAQVVAEELMEADLRSPE